MRVDAQMKVEYVMGVDKIRHRLAPDDHTDWHPRETKETVAGWVDIILVALPNCTTIPGEKWQRSWTFHSMDVEACSTTTSTDDGSVKVDGRTLRRILLDSRSAYTPGQGLTLKEDQATGCVLFDAVAGRLVTAEYQSHRIVENTRASAEKEGGRESEVRKQLHVRLLDHNPLLPPRPTSIAPRPAGKLIGNTIDMSFVAVPAGKFLMGSPDDEPGRTFMEAQHEVEIKAPFYIGTTTVTVGQFRRFVEETGYKTTAEATGIGGQGWDPRHGVAMDPSYTWKNPGYPQTDRHPVGAGVVGGRTGLLRLAE